MMLTGEVTGMASARPFALSIIIPALNEAEAIGHVREGRNVVIVTGTASGKTLCYNLPVFDAILRDPEEAMPPSNKGALKRFVAAGASMGVAASLHATLDAPERIGFLREDGPTERS